MNRGRRRGGGPSLTGLRDGVKRRLFDPHLVPTKPDAKFSISRLIPFSITEPPIVSFLKDSTTVNANDDQAKKSTDKYKSDMFHLDAVIEHAFRCGPFHHSMPGQREGIEMICIGDDRSQTTAKDSIPKYVSRLHLLLAHNDISRWSNNSSLKDTNEPNDWYPNDLVHFIQKEKKKVTSYKPSFKFKMKSKINDIDDVITDQLIQLVTEIVPENDDDAPEKLIHPTDADDDANSEDARWNGDLNAADNIDMDQLDDDEFDNDYCQTYFDNGEGDFSDDGGLGGVGADDGDGGDGGATRYYD